MSIELHPEIQEYLDRVCSRVLNPRARKEIRKELLTHLREAIEAREAQGIQEPEAIRLAILAMGDAQALGKSFDQVHRPFYLNLPLLAGIAACSAIIATALASRTISGSIERLTDRTSSIIEKHRARFLEDQAVLSAEPFFRLSGTERDAGEFLNTKIRWETKAGGIYAHFNDSSLLNLPKEALDLLKSRDESWLESPALDVTALDLSWMTALHKYDHWDLFNSGPMAEVLKDHWEEVTWFSIALPDYRQIRASARIRLLKGIEDRNLLPALREVRQLAKLIYSNEILIATVMAPGILDDERKAFEYGVTHKLIQKSDWSPVSKELSTRAKRAGFAFPQMFSMGADLNFMDQVFTSKQTQAGYCSALSEGAVAAAIQRAFMPTRLPLEMDMNPRFLEMEKIMETSKGHCRLGLVRRIWTNPNETLRWFKDSKSFRLTDGSSSLWERIKFGYLWKIPLLRQMIALQVFDLAFPDYMSSRYSRFKLEGEN